MSSASFATIGTQAATSAAMHPDSERATAEALFKMVAELEVSASLRRKAIIESPRSASDHTEQGSNFIGEAAPPLSIVDDETSELSKSAPDGSKTFCEWLTSVRALQRNAADRKKMIASFAMLVFHSGIEGNHGVKSTENLDLLSKEQLNFVSRAPGWNQNERRILAVLKNHFNTIKRLTGAQKEGISYADMSSLFSSKKKLRERLAMTASEKCAKSGIGLGLMTQILVIVLSLEFGLNLSLFFALIGAVVGLYKEHSLSGAMITGVKGALWGISAGAALGAVVGANQANRLFDETLACGVDCLRSDIAELCFD